MGRVILYLSKGTTTNLSNPEYEEINYERRIVAFLDILGWSDIIQGSKDKPELVNMLGSAIQCFAKEQEMAEWQQQNYPGEGPWPGDPRVSHFSDSILLSFTHDFRGISQLESSLDHLCLRFYWKGLLIRGGITIGDIFHQKQTVFGPALVDAYNLEQSAIYPRIVVNGELEQTLKVDNIVVDRDKMEIGRFNKWCRCHADGALFFDTLGSQTMPPASTPNSIALDAAHKIATEGLVKYEASPNILRKYMWLAIYVNSKLDEFPQVNLPKINID